jgi:hypothetical protein
MDFEILDFIESDAGLLRYSILIKCPNEFHLVIDIEYDINVDYEDGFFESIAFYEVHDCYSANVQDSEDGFVIEKRMKFTPSELLLETLSQKIEPTLKEDAPYFLEQKRIDYLQYEN